MLCKTKRNKKLGRLKPDESYLVIYLIKSKILNYKQIDMLLMSDAMLSKQLHNDHQQSLIYYFVDMLWLDGSIWKIMRISNIRILQERAYI